MNQNSNSTILVVDDEEIGRATLEALLTGQGYDLSFASNGPEALIKAAAFAPDLILLDVMMPDMDGFEVCQTLRSDPNLAEIPVIMVTALDDRDSRLHGLEAGADDFISKPIDRVELRARVRTITRLNHHRRLRTLELKAERDRTQAILEALGEAVVVTDLSGTIRYINPATVTLTGYSSEEAIGESWHLWQSGHQLTTLYPEIENTVRTGQTWRGEVTYRHKDGQFYEAALTVAPLFNPYQFSQVVGFVSVQRDITPIKEAERLKNQFISNVSHELRTPLSIITLLSGNLDTLYQRLNDDKRQKLIQDIRKHARVLNDLIGSVLEISRIDSKNIDHEWRQIDLAQLIREEANKQCPIAKKNAQTLKTTGPDSLGVWGNDGQIRQVIRNLLNNAIKYTFDHGKITCEWQTFSTIEFDEADWPGCLDLPAGDWAAVRIIDTGIGISPKDLPLIFKRFYRVKTQGNIPGTGLGLSIVQELIEWHGGHIAVASKPGKGSIFALYLPSVRKGQVSHGNDSTDSSG